MSNQNEQPNLNGPESMPLMGRITSLPLIVSVLENDKIIREEKIDYSNPEHRKWLGRVTVWAVMSGYTVECRKNDTVQG